MHGTLRDTRRAVEVTSQIFSQSEGDLNDHSITARGAELFFHECRRVSSAKFPRYARGRTDMKTDSTDASCFPSLPPLSSTVTVIVGRAYWQRRQSAAAALREFYMRRSRILFL
jgi:hypothetical protein